MTIEYLKLVRHVLNRGRVSKNRTGIDTLAVFGYQMRYDLTNNRLPMITTKHVNFEMIAKELFWFLRGDTNQRHLEEQNVKIWKANCSREFLDSRNLHHYIENETLGPIYGFQWRHFGAKYIDSNTDYTGQGIDQLAKVFDAIRNNPTDRRIIMSAWNPMDLDIMALPPCHSFIQFDVDVERGELSGQMYQRSADIMLGVPYNITSYSLLIHIIAQSCGLKAGEFVHTIGNAHIYNNHINCAIEQLNRKPYEMPKIEMHFGEMKTFEEFTKFINSLDISMFKLIDYKHHDRLFYKMAV